MIISTIIYHQVDNKEATVWDCWGRNRCRLGMSRGISPNTNKDKKELIKILEGVYITTKRKDVSV